MDKRKCMLCILDGWGHREKKEHNAIAGARTPNFDRYRGKYPFGLLSASGFDVGLPRGMMGNSEVGHLNLGAGRIVWQEITRINRAIEEGPFFEIPAFRTAIQKAFSQGGRLHLMGLTSDGGVHSAEAHYFALLELAKKMGLPRHRVVFHAITDGRDTPPNSGLGFVGRVDRKMQELGIGRIGTVIGRYYSMDRDKRWERLEKAWRAYTAGEGTRATSWKEAVEASYAAGVTDEFILPIVLTENGEPFGLVKDNDSVIFFNFRADRGREISYAFTDPGFQGFPRPVRPRVQWATMTQYDSKIPAPVAFQPQNLARVFPEHLSGLGLTQFRIAETEKYAHVTYFFNGGKEQTFPGEERVLIPSPKVPQYNEMPEMSAREVTGKLLERLDRDLPDFVLVNYANPDMVGHTGDYDAAVKAIEVVDGELGKVVDAFTSRGGVAFITADHGNAELMWDEETNQPHTAHTTNPVPAILAGEGMEGRRLAEGGKLCDVAPTLGTLLGIALPPDIEGRNLLEPR